MVAHALWTHNVFQVLVCLHFVCIVIQVLLQLLKNVIRHLALMMPIAPLALVLINNVQVVELEAKLVTHHLALEIQLVPQITVLMVSAKCAITKMEVLLSVMDKYVLRTLTAHQEHVMEVNVHLAHLVMENIAMEQFANKIQIVLVIHV